MPGNLLHHTEHSTSRDGALEEPVHHGPGGPGLPRQAQGLPHLPEDFALAKRERVEPGGHAKEVTRGVPPDAMEAGAFELRLVQAAPLREISRQAVSRALV